MLHRRQAIHLAAAFSSAVLLLAAGCETSQPAAPTPSASIVAQTPPRISAVPAQTATAPAAATTAPMPPVTATPTALSVVGEDIKIGVGGEGGGSELAKILSGKTQVKKGILRASFENANPGMKLITPTDVNGVELPQHPQNYVDKDGKTVVAFNPIIPQMVDIKKYPDRLGFDPIANVVVYFDGSNWNYHVPITAPRENAFLAVYLKDGKYYQAFMDGNNKIIPNTEKEYWQRYKDGISKVQLIQQGDTVFVTQWTKGGVLVDSGVILKVSQPVTSTSTPNAEATKAAVGKTPEPTRTPSQEILNRKPLFNLENGKSIPLGVTDKGWTPTGLHTVSFSGFISRGVWEENGELFFGLAVPSEADPSKEVEMKVYFAQSNETIYKIGSWIISGRKIDSRVQIWRGKTTRELTDLLVKGDQVVVDMYDDITSSGYEAYKNLPDCDASCQLRLKNIVRYIPLTKTAIDAIKSASPEEKVFPAGPGFQFIIGQD